MSNIKDSNLRENGHAKINWVTEHMPVLNHIAEDFQKRKPFNGEQIAICLHLEAKTAYLAEVLSKGGANVAITGSNPLSTQDDVCAALAERGVDVYSWYGETNEEYHKNLWNIIDPAPTLILDDGGDLTTLLHTDAKDKAPMLKGGAEETTTGVIRLKSMEQDGTLQFPMMAVNNAYSKYLFDNRHGTGQSVWDGIMRTTNLMVSGKNVVVIGFGWCGKGVAQKAKGLGANIIVTEVDPIKASEAVMEGYRVMPLQDACKEGDFFITVTGCKHVIDEKHFALMKDGAILANAGHFDIEINLKSLREMSRQVEQARQNIDRYELQDGKNLYVLGEGRLVNLASGDGHPTEIMDLTFGLQALTLDYLKENSQSMNTAVYDVPFELDTEISRLNLIGMGIEIDTLTKDQIDYLNSWEIE